MSQLRRKQPLLSAATVTVFLHTHLYAHIHTHTHAHTHTHTHAGDQIQGLILARQYSAC
jgi:hypothetical protein